MACSLGILSRFLTKPQPRLGKIKGVHYQPDFLGAGFESAQLDLEPDQFSARSITLTRYLPGKDPKATLPDRVVPDNLAPGGAPRTDSFTVLPPAASPQQPGEPGASYPGTSNTRSRELPPPLAKPLTEAQQQDPVCLQDYLHRELEGRAVNVAETWGEAAGTPGTPKFVLVYVHGWNDYFYQPHLARMFSQLGAAFYALDLHRYGRNMPQWSEKAWNGYTEDFTEYDFELNWAVAHAREEHPGLPLLVMGHSMGGLVVSGWAARHHEAFDGIIFNSPWLEHDMGSLPAQDEIRHLIAIYGREKRLPFPQWPASVYSDSLVGYRALSSPLPRRLVPFQNDPSVAGWVINPLWRRLTGAPTFLSWVANVFQTHRWLASEATFPDKPVLVLSGNHHLDPRYQAEVTRVDQIMQDRRQQRRRQLRQQLREHNSAPWHQLWRDNAVWLRDPFRTTPPRPESEPPELYRPTLVGWTEAARHTDTVLNGELIGQRARELFGDNLTFRLLSGYHDLTLSQPLERAEFFAEISDWLAASGILN